MFVVHRIEIHICALVSFAETGSVGSHGNSHQRIFEEIVISDVIRKWETI